MRIEKVPLGLCLSLSSSKATCHHPLETMSPTTSLFGSSLAAVSERRTKAILKPMMIGGIDVNSAPIDEWEVENDVGGSSPNSTISGASVIGKRRFGIAGVHLASAEFVEAEQDSSRGVSDEEDCEAARKKLRLSKDQSSILEDRFKEHSTLNPKQKLALAKQLNLRPRQVEVWFQNRRARTKLKQTEVDCEFLKRCCDNLRDENRRLQKEVQELRALKLSPQVYMHVTPPMTLNMCPSCERITLPLLPTAAASSGESHHFAPTPCAAAGARPQRAPIPIRPSFLDTPPLRQ